MNPKIAAALAAVKAFGARALAIADETAKPELTQLHDDAVSSVETLGADAVQVVDADVRAMVTRVLTPTVGAEGAAKLAEIFAAGGENALRSALRV
jgi:hypothetical protein